MGTRCGDIDPAAVQYIAAAHKFTIEKAVNYLNKDCGLKALAGLGTSDMRDLIANIDKHDVQGAISVYCHRITKYIGAYIAAMNGVDAIAWTGGVGTNMPLIREKVMAHFEYIGAHIDPQINAIYYNNHKTGEITANGDKPAHVRTFVVTTNEELEIAMETAALLGNSI
jgi:acetate kinase